MPRRCRTLALLCSAAALPAAALPVAPAAGDAATPVARTLHDAIDLAIAPSSERAGLPALRAQAEARRRFGGLMSATLLDALVTPILFRLYGRKPLDRRVADARAAGSTEAF